MPIIPENRYRAQHIYKSGHFQTIWSSKFRKFDPPNYTEELIDLPDGDFLELDWLKSGSPGLVILTHGLEGSSRRTYMNGMSTLLHNIGWDVLSWNNRSCGSKMNKTRKLYGHGTYEDLEFLAQCYAAEYEHIALIGFSMGGNITLNYLAKSQLLPDNITGAVAISAPLKLDEAAGALNKWQNKLYYNYFLKSLKEKVTRKEAQFKEIVDLSKFNQIDKWEDFDDYFTAVIGGYESAQDFYDKSSTYQELEKISCPIYLLNAQNDPILTSGSFPYKHFANKKIHYMEPALYGGHVGYYLSDSIYTYSEIRAAQFLNSMLNEEKFD